jgi:GalNAc-alpha-(1->4)-GalNAc-alpha-(1->3)-diNAcBac-PP-undecaprenol alpha-1,4-N-acetyl-D-galactosaminyltransferase
MVQNMRSLKIISATLSHGGSERVISTLSGEFLKYFDNVEIILYYSNPIWYKVDPRVKITIIDEHILNKGVLTKAKWLRNYINNDKPEIVISFLAPFNMFTLISLMGLSIPVIVADRNDPRFVPVTPYLRFLRNILYHFASGIVVQTKSNKSYFSNLIQEKCKVIFNPIFLNIDAGSALVSTKKKKIASVGRLTKQKNQVMLINAFGKLHEKYPEYNLVIYGEGPMREELTKYIKSVGLEKFIELPGAKQDVCNYILDSELFVMTSNYEGMPNALIEAMCLGLPVISTKVSGATDLIKNRENGLLIEIGSEKELEQGMLEVLSNTNFAHTLGQNAVEVIDQLNLDVIVSQWMDMLNETIHSKNRFKMQSGY